MSGSSVATLRCCIRIALGQQRHLGGHAGEHPGALERAQVRNVPGAQEPSLAGLGVHQREIGVGDDLLHVTGLSDPSSVLINRDQHEGVHQKQREEQERREERDERDQDSSPTAYHETPNLRRADDHDNVGASASRVVLTREGAVTISSMSTRIGRRVSHDVHRRERVLVVEDDDDIRGIIEFVLSADGFPVDVAKDGIDAFDKLEATRGPPPVILLDMMMPRMDGETFLRALRRKPGYSQSAPVIVISGNAAARDKARDLDAVAYLFEAFRNGRPAEVGSQVRLRAMTRGRSRRRSDHATARRIASSSVSRRSKVRSVRDESRTNGWTN